MNELLELYQNYWKNYFNFDGYESVRSYWLTILCCFVVNMALGIVICIPFIGVFLAFLYALACIIPGLSLTARRLRDGGYTPLFMLLYLIPCVGCVTIIIMCCMPSKRA